MSEKNYTFWDMLIVFLGGMPVGAAIWVAANGWWP